MTTKQIHQCLLVGALLLTSFGCAVGTKMKVPIASPSVGGDLSGIKADVDVGLVSARDIKTGNAESDINGDVGGDVAGTKLTIGAGSGGVALWLAITGLVVALVAGPFGGHYYKRVLRPKRMRKEGRCGECGKSCKEER